MSQTVNCKGFGEQAGEPSTYRVQRLKPPPKSEFHATLSQVFGGGMMGISKDGWKVIQQVMDFDYMGNAEYEFGAVPKALNNIVAERADYEAWSFVIKGSEVKLGWWRQRGFDALRRAEIKAAKDKGEKPPRLTPKHKKALVEQAGAPIPDTTIYVVSHKQQGRGVVDCDGNHEQDELHCYKCGYRTTGRAFAQACVKKADLVPCECCKGKGFVPRKKKP